jgi:hypothetical protein
MATNRRTPMLSPRRATTVLTAAVLVTCGPAASASAASSLSPPQEALATAHLLSLRVEEHPMFDRVLLTLSSLTGSHVTPTDELDGQGSGKPIPLPESHTYLDISLNPADTEGYSGPARITPGLPNVKAIANLGAYEGYVQVGVGLDHRSGYSVSTQANPAAIIIDVQH